MQTLETTSLVATKAGHRDDFCGPNFRHENIAFPVSPQKYSNRTSEKDGWFKSSPSFF